MSEIPKTASVFIGVNIGLDKVMATAVAEDGTIIAETFSPYNLSDDVGLLKGRHEQRPEIWWDSTRMAIGQLIGKIRNSGVTPPQLKAICVCGVPGAIVVLDRAGRTLMNAILGDDSRGIDQIKRLNLHGQEHSRRLGITFDATSPIAKIAWLKEYQPDMYENAIFVHQVDYIIGKLKGFPDVTEYTIAFGTGCDLIEETWPDWLDYDMHLGVRERLPKLAQMGTMVGKVNQSASAACGLPTGLPVVMGSTTDTALFIASGTRRTGDFGVIIDDHLHISGFSKKMLLYSSSLHMYKLPGQMWFFNTESCTGGEWIHVWFNEANFPELEAEAEKLLPSDYLAYPNARKGEIFPFNYNSAEGFISPATDNHPVQFASCMQGTALFERLCYQTLDKISGTSTNGDIYSAGKWSSSDIWMQCRADVCGRVNHRLSSAADPAFGAAMIGAIGAKYHTLEAACDAMLHVENSFYPNPDLVPIYQERFATFSTMLEEQGYIS